MLVNFSETIHAAVLSLDVLYRAHSGLFRDVWMFHHEHSLSLALKMADISLVIISNTMKI